MDIQSRKILFVQEFLRIENEKLIKRLEQALAEAKKQEYEKNLKPMSRSELNNQIKSSLADVEANRVTEAKTLYKKSKKWR